MRAARPEQADGQADGQADERVAEPRPEPTVESAAAPAEAAGDLRAPGAILLLSLYELGHTPHGLALPMGFLEQAGFRPAALDLAVQPLDPAAVTRARLVVLSVPMHTALRLGVECARRIRAINADAALVFAGLYAPLNAAYLRDLGGADASGRACVHILGGEWEADLVRLAESFADDAALPTLESTGQPIALRKQAFPRPSRRGLPPLSAYARIERPDGARALAGYAETSRGCREMCRHCPVPPVYGSRIFVIPADAVLDDIAAQVEAGAEHITFGDPDFLNGPGHAMRVVEEMHARWPHVSFDITTQVANIAGAGTRSGDARRARDVARLGALGCAFIVSAVESLSDTVLEHLAKRHRRAHIDRALTACADAGVALSPTFVPFTPWTRLADMVDLVEFIADRGLAGAIDPVQLSVRLLVPPGSLLLANPGSRDAFGALDAARLTHRWQHPDPRMDALQAAIEALCARHAARADASAGDAEANAPHDRTEHAEHAEYAEHVAQGEPADTFQAIRALVRDTAGLDAPPPLAPWQRRRVPRVTEPWFC